MKSLLETTGKSPQFQTLGKYIEKNETIDLFGIVPSFKPCVMAGMAETFRKSILWVTPSWNSCEKMFEAVHPYFCRDRQERLAVFPEFRQTGDQDLSPSLRMKALKLLSDGEDIFLIAPFQALLQNCEDSSLLKKDSLIFEVGDELPIDDILDKLEELGYHRNFQVENRGEYSRRGGILDIYPSTSDPVRIEFFGDEIESIRTFDLNSQVSIEKIKSVVIYPKREYNREKKLLDLLPEKRIIVLDDPAVIKFCATERHFDEERDLWEEFQNEVSEVNTVNIASWSGKEEEKGIHFETTPVDSFSGNIEKFIKQLQEWNKNKEKLIVSTQQVNRFREMFREFNISGASFSEPNVIKPGTLAFIPGDFGLGFTWADQSLRLITDKDILGASLRKRRVLRTWDKSKALDLSEIKPGDRVVHISHGIGIFSGLAHLTIEGVAKDFVTIEYHKGDKLYVPAQQLDLLQKYTGPESKTPNLSRLGSSEWIKTRRKVKASTEAIAKDLLELYAAREQTPGHAFGNDTPWQWELEAAFPYEETPDQETAIIEVKKDLETPRPMDRLICGDAGFGKTEVALRAAFKVVQGGKQVAMLVPTTLLASQHFDTFKARLAPFPMEVDLLCRFRSKKEQKETVARLTTGESDIVVGTHRLISKDIKFKDLGLLIIDEEQHFGVIQKEKIKKLRENVDILTLSATPIPRTLHMSFSGIRDMSVIETPPDERLPVKTHLMEYDKELIRSAIIREMDRGGQVYFLHNRVQDIERIAKEIRDLVPFAKIGVGHGQMEEEELEILMMDFLEGNYDVLVCTTIVESGLDIPNVNTIIINNSQNFGLSQLYQLRGRVGRSNHQAYAYLLYPPHLRLTEEAQQRLEAIRDFAYLGAGFQIAKRDLEIRGAGNLLGIEQSGAIAAVGFDLYCQLLKEAVDEKRGIPISRGIESPVVDLPVNSFIPETYIPDTRIKLEMYRKISKIRKMEEIGKIIDELEDRFGAIPIEVKYLIDILKIKLLAWDLGCPTIKENKKEVHLLLPAVQKFSLRRVQRIYEQTEITCRFSRADLILEDLFGKQKKTLMMPDKSYGKPEEWLPKLIKLLEYLVMLKEKKQL